MRSTFSRAFLGCASLCIALVLAEAATRLFTNVAPPLDAADPIVGKTYVPNFTGTVYVDECDCDVFLRFNREGFRGLDRPYDKAPGTHRVAVIGDSIIAAIATAEQDTLVVKLENALNVPRTSDDAASARDTARTDTAEAHDWEVMNFGVSGASTAQELVLYEARVRRYHPDVVVLGFFLRNDVTDNSPELGSSPRVFFDLDPNGELFRVRTKESRGDDEDWLNQHSRFYVWQKLMIGRIRGRWGRLDRSRFAYLASPGGDSAHAWEITGALLRAFKSQVSADEASLVVAALPGAESVYDDVWADLLARSGEDPALYEREAPERTLTDICNSANIPLVTMTHRFRAFAPHASSKRDDERLFWQGIGHFNASGNALAADAIAPMIVRDLKIRTRP